MSTSPDQAAEALADAIILAAVARYGWTARALGMAAEAVLATKAIEPAPWLDDELTAKAARGSAMNRYAQGILSTAFLGIGIPLAILSTGPGHALVHHDGSPPLATQSAPAAPAPGLSCADIAGDTGVTLADLRAADRDGEDAWLGGLGNGGTDLNILAGVAGGASGTDPLDAAARALATDATDYLAAAGSWPGGYGQVRADLNAVARICGLRPAPSPPGQETAP